MASTQIVQTFQHVSKEDNEFTDNCKTIVYDVEAKRLSVCELVEQLGPFLTDASPIKRELGILILSAVLENLPENFLLDSQLKILQTFLCNRLQENHQVIPAVLRCMLALSKFHQLTAKMAHQMLSAVFEYVPCQMQQQPDRLNIFKLFQSVFSRHTIEYSTSSQYAFGVMSAIDGERDPTNLLFLFHWLPGFLKTANLTGLEEEMFECIGCYFPVDFRAPQESNKLSRDNLADGLASCLTASPHFANYCLPLALEKLDSTLQVAQIDALNLITKGSATFGVAVYTTYCTGIWPQIQKILFTTNDAEVRNAAYRALQTVIAKISENTDNIFNDILKDIVDTVKGNLLPDSHLFKPSCMFLVKIGAASKPSCMQIVKEIVPILTNMFTLTQDTSVRCFLLESLTEIETAYYRYHQIIDLLELKEVSVLSLTLIFNRNENMKVVALKCLQNMSNHLPLEVRKIIYESLSDFIMKNGSNNVEVAFLELFRMLAINYKVEILCVTKRMFVNRSPLDERWTDTHFRFLHMLCTEEFFEDFVYITIINSLENIDIITNRVTLKNLKKMLLNKDYCDFVQRSLVKRKFLKFFLDWCCIHIDSFFVQENTDVLNYILSVLKLVVGFQSISEQKLLVEVRIPKLIQEFDTCRKDAHIFVISGILSNLRCGLFNNFQFLKQLVDAVYQEQRMDIINVLLQLVANLINKWDNDADIEHFLEMLETYVAREDSFDSLYLMAWVTKALITRNFYNSHYWINRVCDLLETNPEQSPEIIEILTNDNCECLSAKAFCNIRILYKHKYFCQIVDRLSGNLDENKTHNLTIFGELIKYTSNVIILVQFPKLLRLIVVCLDESDDEDVLLVLLGNVNTFLRDNEYVMEEYIQELLPRFIKLSSFEESMKVRMAALKCIQNYATGYTLYKLLPFKQDVLDCLGKSIDDRKRLVRSEAVKARMLWFLLDSPV